MIKLLSEDFFFCVSQLFFAFRNYSPVIIVSFVGGNFIAGQFKIVEQIINLIRTYLQLFFKFSYSYVCFEINKNLKKGRRLWAKLNGYNYLLLLLLVLIIMIFAGQILYFFKVNAILLSQLKKYLHIALVIPLLVGLTLPLEQFIFSINKNKIYIKITIIITILNTIALLFIMKYLGLKGVFYVLIITETTLIFTYFTLLKSYLFKKLSNEKYN